MTTLRRASADDEAFVRRVFVEASNAGLRASGLPDHQLVPLLEMQYASRSAQWRAAFSSPEQYILERDGEPVGAAAWPRSPPTRCASSISRSCLSISVRASLATP